MRRILLVVMLPVIAGCLTARDPQVARWPVEYVGASREDAEPKYGVTRVAQVVVRSPYDVTELAVLRADGTVALDPCNAFIARPSILLKGVVCDALEASGRFGTIVNAASVASAAASVEVTVTRLALDCTREGTRQAVASLVLTVLRGHEIREVLRGEASVDAADGRYGAAFSGAVSAAMRDALKQMR